MPLPLLPPAFQLVALDPEVDAFGRARRAAPRGLDDGTVYWTNRDDRLRLAVALEPEVPRGRVLEMVYVLTVAAGEVLPVAFAWPGGLVLDGSLVGRIRAAVAPMAEPEAVPPWLVLGLEVELEALARAVTVVGLTERVMPQFLTWTQRWQEEGLAPARTAWNARRFDREGMGLDANGCFRIGETSLALDAVLDQLG